MEALEATPWPSHVADPDPIDDDVQEPVYGPELPVGEDALHHLLKEAPNIMQHLKGMRDVLAHQNMRAMEPVDPNAFRPLPRKRGALIVAEVEAALRDLDADEAEDEGPELDASILQGLVDQEAETRHALEAYAGRAAVVEGEMERFKSEFQVGDSDFVTQWDVNVSAAGDHVEDEFGLNTARSRDADGLELGAGAPAGEDASEVDAVVSEAADEFGHNPRDSSSAVVVGDEGDGEGEPDVLADEFAWHRPASPARSVSTVDDTAPSDAHGQRAHYPSEQSAVATSAAEDLDRKCEGFARSPGKSAATDTTSVHDTAARHPREAREQSSGAPSPTARAAKSSLGEASGEGSDESIDEDAGEDSGGDSGEDSEADGTDSDDNSHDEYAFASVDIMAPSSPVPS